jgi:hypothetical protein
VTCATKTQKRVVTLRDSPFGDTSNAATESIDTPLDPPLFWLDNSFKQFKGSLYLKKTGFSV